MKILVWDLPTRLFHWLFALCFLGAWFTAESDLYLDLHVFAGYLFLGLALFRLVWGLAGSRYARFRSFLFTPAQAIGYLLGVVKMRPERYVGHNPVAAWAVYALLVLGVALSVTGLFAFGGEEQQGALRGATLYTGGEVFKEIHGVLAVAMLWLVLLHIIGVLAESGVHHENLTKAMLSGYKEGRSAEAIDGPRYLIAALMVAALIAYVAWFFRGYVSQSAHRPYLPFAGKTLPDNKLWREECGSCHLAYHPTLLPARSWERLMQAQNDHFGESLGLEAGTAAEILQFMRTHSAGGETTEPAFKINRSIPGNETPLRITQTPYWIQKHQDIRESVWSDPAVGSKGNCGACHRDAEKGTFEDAAMRLPRGLKHSVAPGNQAPRVKLSPVTG